MELEAFLLVAAERTVANPSRTDRLSPAVFHGPGIDQPLTFVHDDSGNCGPSDAAGFREQVRSLQTDGLGSVTSLVSETSGFFRALNLKERYTYESFGTPSITSAGPDELFGTADDTHPAASAFENPYLFTGREYDAESGLYYYRARYYDPRTGRFLQEDPLNIPEDMNTYPYVDNNPVNFVDPNGNIAIVATGPLIVEIVREALILLAAGVAAFIAAQSAKELGRQVCFLNAGSPKNDVAQEGNATADEIIAKKKKGSV